MHFAWGPTLVLTAWPIEALILASWQTTEMIDSFHEPHLLTDLADYRYRIISVRLGQIEDLNALILGLIPIAHRHASLPEEIPKLLDHRRFER